MSERNTGIRKRLEFSGTYSVVWQGYRLALMLPDVWPGYAFAFGSAGVASWFGVGCYPYFNGTAGGGVPVYHGTGYFSDGTSGTGQFYEGYQLNSIVTGGLINITGTGSDDIGWTLLTEIDRPNLSGTIAWSAYIDAELWEITGEVDPGLVDYVGSGLYVPNVGGPGYPDGLPASAIRFEWRSYEGGIVHAEASGGFNVLDYDTTLSSSQTGEVPADMAGIVIPTQVDSRVIGYIASASSGANSIASLAVQVSVAGVDTVGATQSHSGSVSVDGDTGTYSAESGGTTSTLTLANAPGGFYASDLDKPTYFVVRVFGSAAYRYQLDGAIRHFGSAPSESFKIRASDGSNSATLNRQVVLPDYAHNITVRSLNVGTSAHQIQDDRGATTPCWVAMDVDDLAAHGDDIRDHRIQAQGKRWAAGTVALAASTSVATSQTATGVTSKTITLPATINTEAYRWLKVVATTSIGGASFTVGLGSKTWTFSGAGTHWVDLCKPGNASDAYDCRDTKFPLSGPRIPGSTPSPTDSVYGGVSRISAVAMTGLNSSCDYGWDLTLEVRDFSRFTPSLLGFMAADVGWISGTDTTFAYTSSWMNTDGRTSNDAWVYVVSGGGTAYWRYYTISEAFSALGELAGVTATETGGLSSPYDNDAPAVGMMGAGQSRSVSGTVEGCDIDINGATKTVYACHLWDFVQGLPGAGDLLSGTTTGTALPIRFVKHVRGQGVGLLLSNSGGYGTSIVQLVRADSQIRGTGMPDARGAYSTGAPYGSGNEEHLIQSAGEQIQFQYVGGRIMTNRFKHRVVFGVDEVEAHPGIANTHNWLGGYMTAKPSAGGIIVSRSDWCKPPYAGAWLATTNPNDSEPAIDAHPDGDTHLAWTRSGTVYFAVSTDDGQSFGTPESLGSGSMVRVASDAWLGHRIVAWFVYNSGSSGPGRIHIKRKNGGDDDWETPWTIPIDFEPNGFDITAPPESGGPWILAAIPEGDTEPSDYESTDDCSTFTLVV